MVPGVFDQTTTRLHRERNAGAKLEIPVNLSKGGDLALTLRERIVSRAEGESISCPHRKHTDMRAPMDG